MIKGVIPSLYYPWLTFALYYINNLEISKNPNYAAINKGLGPVFNIYIVASALFSNRIFVIIAFPFWTEINRGVALLLFLSIFGSAPFLSSNSTTY